MNDDYIELINKTLKWIKERYYQMIVLFVII